MPDSGKQRLRQLTVDFPIKGCSILNFYELPLNGSEQSVLRGRRCVA